MPLSFDDVVLKNKVLGPIFRRKLAEQRLAKASERQLNKLADRAFTASSLDEIFRKN